MLYVPLGYADCFAELSTLDELRGGSAWGSGTFAGQGGVRQPSELELKVARIQGKSFSVIAGKLAK
jgi:NAD(P)H dehydrogenase (quinone)